MSKLKRRLKACGNCAASVASWDDNCYACGKDRDYLKPVERDQLAEIALLMCQYHIHEHTINSLTIESVEALVEGMKEAWIIINVLNMSELDNGEAYPRAMTWLEKWADFQPEIYKEK